MPKYDAQYFGRLYVRATDIARAVVDVVAFSTGGRLLALLDMFIDPSGVGRYLPANIDSLAKECTVVRAPVDTGKVLGLVLSHHEVFMALRDLIEANTDFHLGAVYCGRVLDAIRRMIAPDEKDLRRAWLAMQTTLKVSEDYKRRVTELSANPGHADRSYIEHEDGFEALRRTWAIMNRFLEYKQQNDRPRRPPEFPLLAA
jgi:hypothetical protein